MGGIFRNRSDVTGHHGAAEEFCNIHDAFGQNDTPGIGILFLKSMSAEVAADRRDFQTERLTFIPERGQFFIRERQKVPAFPLRIDLNTVRAQCFCFFQGFRQRFEQTVCNDSDFHKYTFSCLC